MGTRYYYLFLPRGPKVEDIGEGSVVGKPHSVLLSYTCLDKKINKKSLLCVHIHQLHLQLLNNKNFLVIVQSLKSCPTLCDPMDCSTPGFPVLHHLPEPDQTHDH